MWRARWSASSASFRPRGVCNQAARSTMADEPRERRKSPPAPSRLPSDAALRRLFALVLPILVATWQVYYSNLDTPVFQLLFLCLARTIFTICAAATWPHQLPPSYVKFMMPFIPFILSTAHMCWRRWQQLAAYPTGTERAVRRLLGVVPLLMALYVALSTWRSKGANWWWFVRVAIGCMAIIRLAANVVIRTSDPRGSTYDPGNLSFEASLLFNIIDLVMVVILKASARVWIRKIVALPSSVSHLEENMASLRQENDRLHAAFARETGAIRVSLTQVEEAARQAKQRQWCSEPPRETARHEQAPEPAPPAYQMLSQLIANDSVWEPLMELDHAEFNAIVAQRAGAEMCFTTNAVVLAHSTLPVGVAEDDGIVRITSAAADDRGCHSLLPQGGTCYSMPPLSVVELVGVTPPGEWEVYGQTIRCTLFAVTVTYL